MSSAIPPTSMPYFHGAITRDQAKAALTQGGLSNGLFLLRRSLNKSGNYVLSICNDQRVLHYSIERQQDGTVRKEDGKKFPGPVELIDYHSGNLDGIAVRPTVPCGLPAGQSPMVWPGVTVSDLDKALTEYAEANNITDTTLTQFHEEYVDLIAKDMHIQQPWFYRNLSRHEAEKIMKESGFVDGKFLIRTNKDEDFAVCLVHGREIKHYKVLKDRNGQLFISGGPEFRNIMDLVGYYHNIPDGMPCVLSLPCRRDRLEVEAEGEQGGADAGIPSPGLNGQYSDLYCRPVDGIVNRGYTELDFPGGIPLQYESQSLESEYRNLPTPDSMIEPSDLELQADLGAGSFGSVRLGLYKGIPVAVKCLKSNLPTSKDDMLCEARNMSGLRHDHVVRMIGVCHDAAMMLVLELAPLGPLNKYLQKHKKMPVEHILKILHQVALGMQYLESKKFIHRDLAARNVLLVTEGLAKISDFGMSRALGIDSNYYKASDLRFPLKWCAPECIKFYKFDLKSDVWSYGITMWEALSYGRKPYKGLTPQEIIDMVEKGHRLDRPRECPSFAYNVMTRCWHQDKTRRPNFSEIVELMKQ